MPKIKTYPHCIRFDGELKQSWHYLTIIKINPVPYLMDGGRKAVIQKAVEMKKPKDPFEPPF